MRNPLLDKPLNLAFNQGRNYVQGVSLLETALHLFTNIIGQTPDSALYWTVAAQFKRELTVNARMLHFTSAEDAFLLVGHGAAAIFDFKAQSQQHLFVVMEEKNRPIVRCTNVDIFDASCVTPTMGPTGWEFTIHAENWLSLVYLIARAHIKIAQKNYETFVMARWAYFESVPVLSFADSPAARVLCGAPRSIPLRSGYCEHRQFTIWWANSAHHINNTIIIHTKD